MADMTTKILTVDLNADAAINGIINLNNAIEQNNKTIKANNAMIAENNKAIKDGTGDVMKLTAQNQRLAESNVELESKTKVLKDEKRLLQKETQNEIRLQTQEEGSLRQLRAQLSNLTKQYDSLSRAERENVNVGGKLKNQINQVTTEIKAAEEGTQRYYRNVGNYKNAILDAIGMNGRFGSSLMQITNLTNNGSTTISQAFTSIGVQAKALGRSLMSLMTNPVFLAIAGIAGAGMAFKWFFDYNVGIEQAMRLTKEFTGLAGEELSNLRAEIQATANTYGKDYEEVLKSVDLLMSNFHMTSQEAIDTINKGFQAGTDLNGDYLQKLQQYGPTFHDAGIEAEQLVAILQQTRSGIFTDQGLDAIRMGSTRIREMSASTAKALQQVGINVDEMERKLADGSMTTFDAMQQISKKLQELPRNSKEYGEVITQVFGRQGRMAAQEMIEGLADINTNLEELTKTTGEYGELTDQLREKDVELEKEMASMFGNGNNGFEEMKLRAKIWIKDGLIAAIKKIKELVNEFKNTWNQTELLRVAVAGLAAWFKVLWSVSIVPMKLVIAGLKTIWNFIKGLNDALKSITNNIRNVFSGIAEIFEGLKSFDPSKVWQGIQDATGAAWSAVSDFAGLVADTFSDAFTNAGGVVVDFIGEVQDAFSMAQDISNYRFSNTASQPQVGAGNAQGVGGGSRSASSSEGGSGSKGGKGGKGKTATAKATTPPKKEKTPEELALEAYNKRIEALTKQGEQLRRKALEEQSKQNLQAIDELAEMERQALYKTYGDREQYEGEALEAWDSMWQEIENRRLKRIEDYNKRVADEEKKQLDQAQKMAQLMISALPEGSQMQYEWQLENLRLMMDAELAMYEDNEEAKMAIRAKYGYQAQQLQQQFAKKQIEIESEKYNAIATITGGLSQLFGEFGEDQKAFAMLQKTLALAEIAINQAVAISAAIKNAATGSITVWGMIAQIATGVTAVTTAMVQAFTSLNQAKFATGGYIRGAGTSTSDSIPVRVSNGESIMNANTTAMFSGLLSSLNQLGGGVPIQVTQTAANIRGEDMLARAFARGVAMLPNPVVSVEDINRGQRQVEVMNERATL